MPFVCGTDRGQTAVALPGDVPTITAGTLPGWAGPFTRPRFPRRNYPVRGRDRRTRVQRR